MKMLANTDRFFANHPVFRLEEFRDEFGDSNKDRTIRNRIQQFLKSQRLRLLSSGIYAVVPGGVDADDFAPDPILVAARLAKDSIIAYHSAFELMGYAQQPFYQTTYLTAGHRRKLQLNSSAFISLPPPRRLGDEWSRVGVETIRRQGLPIKVTSRERTLVDCLDRQQYSGGFEELFACVGAMPSMDFGLLESYLEKLHSPTLYARVGFVLERFADRLFIEDQMLERLAKCTPKSPVYLLRRSAGNVLVRRWNLLAPPETLRQDGSVLQ